MKVSVISTVLNEEGSVGRLVDSLLNQTHKPDEIVIVDGGSRDATFSILQEFADRHSEINIFQVRGNISRGRNEAVKAAKYNIIAQIDGGCVAHEKWLERIIAPLEDKDIGLSAGFYVMTGDDPLQLAVAPFHGVTPRKFDPRNFLPSGRSVAFRKETWKIVGGYSEELQWAGEDTLFNYKVIKSNIKIARVPEAYVYWEVPDTFALTIKKFFKYAIGDAETGIWWHPGKNLSTHNIKIFTIFLRYFLAALLFYLATFNAFFLCALILYLVVYTSWSMWKLRDEVDDLQAKLLIPLIQISSDIAIMAGFLVGGSRRLRR